MGFRREARDRHGVGGQEEDAGGLQDLGQNLEDRGVPFTPFPLLPRQHQVEVDLEVGGLHLA